MNKNEGEPTIRQEPRITSTLSSLIEINNEKLLDKLEKRYENGIYEGSEVVIPDSHPEDYLP